MIPALDSAASGMSVQQYCLDVTADNIANISTNGFKSSHAEFTDLLYGQLAGPSGTLQVGRGARLINVSRDFSDGTLEQTGDKYDLAISGDGLFQVQLADGSIGYTRAGKLSLDAGGQLKLDGCYILQPPVTVPANAKSLTVTEDGKVTVRTAGSKTDTQIGQISLTKFPNPQGLLAIGDGIFVQTANSGQSVTAVPGQNGLGVLRQGFSEKSNVDAATEMTNMITTLRAYELNSKVLQNADESMNIANNILRR
jgi:flagellar basal-body rod protein FlgG